MAGEIQLNGTSFASESGGTITLNNGTISTGVVFPAGHMLRQFYDEHYFNSSPVSITTTASNWSGLEIAITNPSTSDYLFLQMFIPDIYAAGSNRGLYQGFVYSTDSFSTETQLGTRNFYCAQTGYATGENITNSTVLVRVQHPTSSNYSIRPYLKAFSNSMSIVQGNGGADSIATLFAMEIQG